MSCRRVTLHGYQYSVYTWIVRFALREKGISHDYREVNPFASNVPADYLAMNPFCRVPTLVDGDFDLYETGAITRYIDEAFEGPNLQPADPEPRAHVNQILSIIDSYVYWPLIRQVFAQGVMGQRMNRPRDVAEYRRGLDAAPRILEALDQLASGGSFLVGDRLTLADIHLGPMASYFIEDEDAQALFKKYGKLESWWSALSARSGFMETTPVLPEPPA